MFNNINIPAVFFYEIIATLVGPRYFLIIFYFKYLTDPKHLNTVFVLFFWSLQQVSTLTTGNYSAVINLNDSCKFINTFAGK